MMVTLTSAVATLSATGTHDDRRISMRPYAGKMGQTQRFLWAITAQYGWAWLCSVGRFVPVSGHGFVTVQQHSVGRRSRGLLKP